MPLPLCNWVFDHFFTLVDEPFEKALRSYKICVIVSNNLCGKLFSSLVSPATSNESFKVTLVPFFIPELNIIKLQMSQVYV